MKKLLASLVFLMIATGAAQAADLVSAEDAQKMLSSSPDTRIIDARGVAARSLTPIPGALVASEVKNLEPCVALLVAARVEAGMKVAADIEAANPGIDVRVVEGGYESIREAVGGHAVGSKPSFTIPTDTCEPGPSLRTYDGDHKNEAK